LIFGIFASLAEFERSLIRERIVLGLMRAKAKGNTPGPIPKILDLKKLAHEVSQGKSLRKLAKLFGVGKDTISKHLKRAK